MALKAAKSMSGNEKMIDATALSKLLSVCDNPEVTDYAYNALEKIYSAAPNPEIYSDVMDSMEQYKDIMQAKSSDTSAYWSGDSTDRPPSEFNNFIASQASVAAAGLKAKFEGGEKVTIQFNFAINDSAELLHGTSMAGGEPLDEETTEQLNALYSEWLTSRNMICDEGVIYKTDDQGEYSLDKKGERVRVDPEEYREMFDPKANSSKSSKQQGFENFVSQKTDGHLQLEVGDATESYFPKEATSSSSSSR